MKTLEFQQLFNDFVYFRNVTKDTTSKPTSLLYPVLKACLALGVEKKICVKQAQIYSELLTKEPSSLLTTTPYPFKPTPTKTKTSPMPIYPLPPTGIKPVEVVTFYPFPVVETTTLFPEVGISTFVPTNRPLPPTLRPRPPSIRPPAVIRPPSIKPENLFGTQSTFTFRPKPPTSFTMSHTITSKPQIVTAKPYPPISRPRPTTTKPYLEAGQPFPTIPDHSSSLTMRPKPFFSTFRPYYPVKNPNKTNIHKIMEMYFPHAQIVPNKPTSSRTL